MHKAQDTLTDTVLPTLQEAFTRAVGKSVEIRDSDAVAEAKRRSTAMLRAARGDVVVPAPRRRWTRILGIFALGAGVGAAASVAVRRYLAVPGYEPTAPTPSATTEDIDLRAGAPTAT